ncbi:uncharacterized protein LOC121050639 [Rosa chinensis]|uniref:uncharacterized protein LOC121050639 n=1 Tax=Rosa chinensis TaxID=74649 RepID=UPI001AD9051E|nr:uncharacterized protein LOC121050639 [Rosa chinensis]
MVRSLTLPLSHSFPRGLEGSNPDISRSPPLRGSALSLLLVSIQTQKSPPLRPLDLSFEVLSIQTQNSPPLDLSFEVRFESNPENLVSIHSIHVLVLSFWLMEKERREELSDE